MDKLLIYGGKALNGEVIISGAKNAALPIMAASLLASDHVTISNVPHLKDITTMMELLGQLGAHLIVDEKMNVQVDASQVNEFVAPLSGTYEGISFPRTVAKASTSTAPLPNVKS